MSVVHILVGGAFFCYNEIMSIENLNKGRKINIEDGNNKDKEDGESESKTPEIDTELLEKIRSENPLKADEIDRLIGLINESKNSEDTKAFMFQLRELLYS